MSNFLLKDPDCIFIHIPKTGGSSIRRGLWQGRYEGPAFGEIPTDWGTHFRFAFVRHPLERLVSAWADFAQIRGFSDGVDAFVDHVLDEDAGHAAGAGTSLTERIRHHTIPQTHPENCLHLADRIGRYERYETDLAEMLARLPHHPGGTSGMALRRTRHPPWPEVLTGSTLGRLTGYYAEDFARLDYPRP